MCRLLIECIGITLKWVEDVLEERDGYKEQTKTKQQIDEMYILEKRGKEDK